MSRDNFVNDLISSLDWTDNQECEFKSSDQCGFIDISEGQTRWIRSHSDSRGNDSLINSQFPNISNNILHIVTNT